jgi:serine/threonine protein kinase
MLTGKFPFKGSVDKEVYCSIKSGVVIYPYEVPPKARLLLRKLLAVDPDERPNCDQIL